jgi:hypothetical protein
MYSPGRIMAEREGFRASFRYINDYKRDIDISGIHAMVVLSIPARKVPWQTARFRSFGEYVPPQAGDTTQRLTPTMARLSPAPL